MSWKEWLPQSVREATPQQIWGGVLALASVGLTIALGFVATSGNALPAILAVLAVVGQFSSAWLFSRHRKADPAHARTIVRQLIGIATRLADTVKYIEQIQEKRNPEASTREIRVALTTVNVQLSNLAETGVQVVENWGDFDPGTLKDLRWNSEPNGSGNPANNEGGQGND